MREDIYGGLKNAMERGATLEQAINSFVNSGYNEAEVREAANNIGAVSSLTSVAPTPKSQVPSISPQPKKFKSLPAQQPQVNKVIKKSHRARKIVILVVILLILIGLLVFTIIFREKVVDLLTSFF